MIDVQGVEKGKGLTGLILAFAAVYLIWGSTYLAIRFAIETAPPFLMMGIRFIIAGSLMYGWLRVRGAARPALREWGAAALIGGLLLLGGTGAVGWSEQFIPSGLAALLVAMVPMWMVLLDWLRPNGRRPGVPVAIGLLVGFAGVMLLVGPIDLSGNGRAQLLALGALMLGTLSWATGSVYSQRLPLPESPYLAASLQMMLGGLLLVLAGSGMGEWTRFDPVMLSLRSGLAILYLIVFGSLIAFVAYAWLLKASTPTRVASYAYVNPVVAVFLGWLLADEPVTARTLIAAGVIIAGVVLIISHRAARRERALQRVSDSSALTAPADRAPGAPAAPAPPPFPGTAAPLASPLADRSEQRPAARAPTPSAFGTTISESERPTGGSPGRLAVKSLSFLYLAYTAAWHHPCL